MNAHDYWVLEEILLHIQNIYYHAKLIKKIYAHDMYWPTVNIYFLNAYNCFSIICMPTQYEIN